MFGLRSLRVCSRRLFHSRVVGRDQLLDQLLACSAEDQVFDVVGRNKAKLSVKHVSCAIGLLWQFQRDRPQMLRTFESVQNHPQFLTLRVLAENKISLLDDSSVVKMLYDVLRLQVEHHDSLVQHLVTEAWTRLERLQMKTLSKFAVCLSDQFLHHSPLMGQITQIVSQRLDSIQDARVLTPLMIGIFPLVSPQLRDALLTKADTLLDKMDPIHFNNPRRVVQFLRNVRYVHRPLLEKCNWLLMQNISHLDVEHICITLGMYQTLQYNNSDFRVAARQRLIELVDTSTDPATFTKLFACLGPMAGQGDRERLESTALLLADELNPQQALGVLEAMEEMQCRNLQLINKMAAILFKNLESYRSLDIARITQNLILLHCQNPEIFSRLKAKLLHSQQGSVFPFEVTILTRVLSMLPSRHLDEGVLSRVEAVLPQCNLNNLNTYAIVVAKWIRYDPSYRHSTPSKYVHLLQSLNRCARERLHKLEPVDVVLEEVKYLSGEWFDEMLLEESMVTLQRLLHQISWTNVHDVAVYLTRTNYFCAALLDRIASMTIENIDKIHYSAIYATLLPFAKLNYDPPTAEQFFDACIQHFTPHISSIDPQMLVLLAYALAMADYFPEEVVREIFNVDFLAKLDAHLETLPDAQNMRIRLHLMELNRAVCLECPEFQVPWFHERYCKWLQKRANSSISPIQQQIHKMLGDVLGGINCAKVGVLTPYFYTVDFELVLDRHLQPVPYSEPSQLQISENGNVHWQSVSADRERTDLPPGARRIALEFLDSKSFCKNSRHMKGEAMMKKRHLEILGYQVLQIPHFEWNSMELSTEDAWKEYLRKKIFTELP
ncbi:FAST kinase domain-containing protein 1, mitochondrial isoform X2 [Pimephales promelas]|uniref:FAST kinase domain-containing protein 1, mitochondrial isoform X2 n=1 Tax=Pimephales promelas TaxID=90988 RepID=UPI00195580E0|nr:FAST kinase domain-containing protein 1, mitochondrial isoform X2 [Pimephales promelas]